VITTETPQRPGARAPGGEHPEHNRAPHPALVVGGVVLLALIVSGATLIGPVAAVALAVLGAGTLVVLMRPATAVLIVTALVPVTSGVQRGYPVPGLRVSEALLVVFLGTVLLTGWTGWRPRWSALEWGTLGYTVATVVFASAGAAINAMSVGPGTLFALLLPVQFLLLSRVLSITLTTYALRRSALRLILMASVPVSVIAFLQYLDVGPVRSIIIELTGAENFERAQELGFAARATGPFDHWHVLAGYLLPVVLLGVALLFDRTQQIMSTAGVATCVGASVMAMTLTFTFTTAFGLIVGVALIAARAGRLGGLLKVGAVAAVVLGGLLGPSMGERISEQFEPRAGRNRAAFVPETVDYRFEVWQEQYLPAVADSPVLGYGPELPESITWVYTESMYLSLQLLGGLPLVLAFAALVWTFLTAMAPGQRSRDPSVQAPARAVIAVTIVLIPMHAIFPYFASPGLPHLVWILAGVALGGRWAEQEHLR
jgi:hypothetical protein